MVDKQPLNLMPCMQVFDYEAPFKLINLVFVELDAHQCRLDFKLFHENTNKFIQRTFCLLSFCDNETSEIYSDLNSTAPQALQAYPLKQLTEIEAHLPDEIEFHERLAKNIKRFNTITSTADEDLITSTVPPGEVFIAAFTSGVVLSVIIALSGTSVIFS